eukprot:1179630-Prorocentrum_minimum.AAC.1
MPITPPRVMDLWEYSKEFGKRYALDESRRIRERLKPAEYYWKPGGTHFPAGTTCYNTLHRTRLKGSSDPLVVGGALLGEREELGDGAVVNAPVLLRVLLAPDGVRLARARLPVREDAHVVAVQDGGHHRRAVEKDVRLRRLRAASLG